MSGLHWFVVLGERPSSNPQAAATQGWVLVCAADAERAVELGAPRIAYLGNHLGLRITCAQLEHEPATQHKREQVIATLPRSMSAWVRARPHLYPWRHIDAAGNFTDDD